MLILGDRYEILAATIAAMLRKIKIAHLHGGEVTQGAIDERIRHSISKMSDIHFVSTLNYKKRLIQLGVTKQSFSCWSNFAMITLIN